jgi:hypothetical protein
VRRRVGDQGQVEQPGGHSVTRRDDQQDAQRSGPKRAAGAGGSRPAPARQPWTAGVDSGARHAEHGTHQQWQPAVAGRQQRGEQQRAADPDEFLCGGIQGVGAVEPVSGNEPGPGGSQGGLQRRPGQARRDSEHDHPGQADVIRGDREQRQREAKGNGQHRQHRTLAEAVGESAGQRRRDGGPGAERGGSQARVGVGAGR